MLVYHAFGVDVQPAMPTAWVSRGRRKSVVAVCGVGKHAFGERVCGGYVGQSRRRGLTDRMRIAQETDAFSRCGLEEAAVD